MDNNSAMDTSSVSTGVKVCSKCHRAKPVTEFHKRRSRPDGLQPWCKDCTCQARRDRYVEKHRTPGGRPVKPYAEMWADGGRRCTGCLEWKTWASFQRKKSGHMGYSARCRLCVNTARASSRRVNVDAVRRAERERKDRTGANYKARYRITREQYEEMARAQGNACAVCGNDEKRLVVDHEHVTGRVRKLLCDRCNRDMAVVDDPGRMALLVAYRDEHRE